MKIEQRVYLTAPDDVESRQQIVPDVYVVKEPQPIMSATGTIAPATVIEPSYDLEIRDRYIEIRDSRNREVVTVIELLSPFNKAAGTVGYEAFQNKRRQVLGSKTHWIEIDLLRVGERPREVTGKSDYYARAHYAESIDYGDNVPPPPLRPADVAWVHAQIEEWRAKAAR